MRTVLVLLGLQGSGMLRFQVFSFDQQGPPVSLSEAYLVGGDGVPVRADFEFRDREILCRKRASGPAALALLWNVQGCGRVVMETTRLPERDQPYNLHVELARGRITRINHKREEWGFYDGPGIEKVAGNLEKARDFFLESLKSDDPAKAAQLADQSLALSVNAGEQFGMSQAGAALERRKETGGFNKRLFGCCIDLDTTSDVYRRRLLNAFDFVSVPVNWRQIEPKEDELDWKRLDGWIEWLHKHRVPIKGGPLVSFAEGNVPDWLYLWEHDFESIRDAVHEHVRRVLSRYGSYIQVWDVISGIHANNCFSFNFEQLMELTRMAAAVCKQLCPRSIGIIDLINPWGEYYARNQRTIPPMLYADMVVQSGINFDAFGLQFSFGPAKEGMLVRDMFQVSAMIDRFAGLGKTVHITSVQVPSAGDGVGGQWHAPWTESVQASWLKAFYEVVLSKPFVDTITWRSLVDVKDDPMPAGGLLRPDMNPKLAYNRLVNIRSELLGHVHANVQTPRGKSQPKK